MKNERLFDLLDHQLKTKPLKDCMVHKSNGQWNKLSTLDVIQKVNELATGLLASGARPGDHIVIMSPTRYQWMIADLAILKMGGITVPIYDTILADDVAYILNQTQACRIFAFNHELSPKIKEAQSIIGTDIPVFYFETEDPSLSWNQLFKKETAETKSQLEEIGQHINGESLATIIYTSGTTGRPKGVMLTHFNILSNAKAVASDYGLHKDRELRALSFLPLSHIFERTTNYFYLIFGIGIYYAEALDKIGDNAKEIKPHSFSAVPRLIEKVYEKINKVAMEKGAIVRTIFKWALNLGKQYDPQNPPTGFDAFKLNLARKLVFAKWKEALGGEIEFIAVGSAATQQMLIRVFCAADIRLVEAYGMTETSPGITMNPLDGIKVGSVGKILQGMEMKIAEDGEIMAKGTSVMQGYYLNEEATAGVFSADGWLHTGDIGRIDQDGYLYITDRKKELFKTSGGKYIAPQVIENKFKESLFIEQIMVLGEGKKFPSALIVPSLDQLVIYCEKEGINYDDPNALLENPKITTLMDKEVADANVHFPQWEKIKKYALVAEGWTVENGMTTPTLKLKRKAILAAQEEKVNFLYEATEEQIS